MIGKTAVIRGTNISFSYDYNDSLSAAVDGVDIEIKKGEKIVILGQNGSGKSTLAKHFNALLPLQAGELTVSGIAAGDEAEIWRLRRLCGMVFQNPDNQFVSSIIEEDIAFGLSNYQVPGELIPDQVKAALKLVGMEGYEKRSPHTLSGGQKQRIALAGVLALEPELLIFDEVTAMLDPESREDILRVIDDLHNRKGITMVMITHYVDEAISADRVCLMKSGKVIGCRTPREILTDMELMEQAGMLPPVPVRLYYDLKAAGITLADCPLTNEELVEEICRWDLLN